MQAPRPLAVLAACTLGALSCAAREPDLAEVLARMPDRAELVLGVDDAARLRDAPAGTHLAGLLLSLPGSSRASLAWRELAETLSMTEEQAFDALLGRRAILTASSLAGDPSWALISEVTPEVEARIRSALGAVPRSMVQGQPVLAIERGSFLLATSAGRLVCIDGRKPVSESASSAVILLSPVEDAAWFASLLPLLRCEAPERTLHDSAAAASLARLPAGDAAMLWRLPAEGSRPSRSFALSLTIDDLALDLHALAAPAQAWAPGIDLAALRPWRPVPVDKLPGNPPFVIAGERPLVHLTRDWLAPLLGTASPTDFSRVADSEAFGTRCLLALWPTDPACVEPGDNTEPASMIASEVTDLETASRAADRTLADLLDLPPLGEDHNSPALRDELLPYVRSVELTPRSAPLLSRSPAAVSWMFVRAAPTEVLDPDADDARDQGWFLLHYQPRTPGAIDIRRAAASLAAPTAPGPGARPAIPGLPLDRYLVIASLRPHAFSPLNAPDGAPPLASLSTIDWHAALDEKADSLTVELHARAQRR